MQAPRPAPLPTQALALPSPAGEGATSGAGAGPSGEGGGAAAAGPNVVGVVVEGARGAGPAGAGAVAASGAGAGAGGGAKVSGCCSRRPFLVAPSAAAAPAGARPGRGGGWISTDPRSSPAGFLQLGGRRRPAVQSKTNWENGVLAFGEHQACAHTPCRKYLCWRAEAPRSTVSSALQQARPTWWSSPPRPPE